MTKPNLESAFRYFRVELVGDWMHRQNGDGVVGVQIIPRQLDDDEEEADVGDAADAGPSGLSTWTLGIVQFGKAVSGGFRGEAS